MFTCWILFSKIPKEFHFIVLTLQDCSSACTHSRDRSSSLGENSCKSYCNWLYSSSEIAAETRNVYTIYIVLHVKPHKFWGMLSSTSIELIFYCNYYYLLKPFYVLRLKSNMFWRRNNFNCSIEGIFNDSRGWIIADRWFIITL